MNRCTRRFRNRGRRRLCISDVTCPICFCIMIEPVTMPCQHEMCMPCFEKNCSTVSLCCPFCRLRISAWSRKAAGKKTLVNLELWEEIQKYFPEEIARRLSCEDEVLTRGSSCSVCVSEPGEIRKEYERTLKEFQREEELLKKEQERRSLELIKKIEEEESKYDSVFTTPTVDNTSVLQHLRSHVPDVELDKPSNLSHSCCDVLNTQSTSPGTEKIRSSSVESDDSISPELHYFKPIRAAPRTPPKQTTDGKLVEPSLVCIKPRTLKYPMDASLENLSMNSVMQNKLHSVKRDRKLNTESVLGHTSNLESINSNHNSDFFAYPVSATFSLDDADDTEVIVSSSSSLGCPQQLSKSAHLYQSNKENELSLSCKNNGKRAPASDLHQSPHSVIFTKKQRCESISKLRDTSKKPCYKCKANELKPQSGAADSPLRLGKFVTCAACSVRKIPGRKDAFSSFVNCTSKNDISSASTKHNTSATSKSGNCSVVVTENFYFHDENTRKEQIEQDYVLASRLQDLYNKENRKYLQNSVKSVYNLRKKG